MVEFLDGFPVLSSACRFLCSELLKVLLCSVVLAACVKDAGSLGAALRGLCLDAVSPPPSALFPAESVAVQVLCLWFSVAKPRVGASPQGPWVFACKCDEVVEHSPRTL